MLYVAFFSFVEKFNEPTLSLGVPTMDTNPTMFSNTHVNLIDNENIDNTDIDIGNENISIFFILIIIC